MYTSTGRPARRGAAIGTVHKQVESINRKLGVGSRRELAARVYARELADWRS